LRRAEQLYQQILQADPGHPEAHNNLGNALRSQGKLEEAVTHCRQALHFRPGFPEAHINLGSALAELGRTEEAVACLRAALRINPGFVEAWTNLGNALTLQDRLDEAVHCHRQALLLNPDYAEAHTNLGEAVGRQGKLDEAASYHQQALRLQPNFATATTNLGFVREQQGQFDEALACYEQALRQDPGHAQAHFDRALLWLLLGNFAQGWPEYEWRWQTKDYPRYAWRRPRWDGSPLAGRTLLVVAEQGLGDTLQFIRYAPLLRQPGGKVIVECQPELYHLLAGLPGVDLVLARGSPLPAIDVEAPLGSLPGIVGTWLATVPATVPYLRADPDLVKHWKSPKSEIRSPKSNAPHPTSDFGLRTSDFLVGIAWQGNPAYGKDRQRSIPLTHFARLAEVEGVHLISLQKGPGADQLKQLRIADCGLRIERQEAKPLLEFAIRNPQSAILDLGDRLDQTPGAFMDTAAVMMNLDLVISSDTAVPHLAGALGVPVWVALPLVPDWRWLLEREDSPWYPTMRLFRQTRYGQWEDVFERMAEEMKGRLAAHKTGKMSGSTW